MPSKWDVVVVGAGAAGMMCAIEAGRRGRRVLVVDHARKAGEKIRISGGGRCNFTNLDCSADNFLSENPKFSVSALSRFSPEDFIARLDEHGVSYHEKMPGQLFCDGSARQVVDMLVSDMADAGVVLHLGAKITDIRQANSGFEFNVDGTKGVAQSLVVACGGKSIPKMGASGYGYQIADEFGLEVVDTRPGLVPLVFGEPEKGRMAALSGVSMNVEVSSHATSFSDVALFTHRGLSGPAILQISSYWQEGEEICVNFCPGLDVFQELRSLRTTQGRKNLGTVLAEFVPKRLASDIAGDFETRNLADMSDKALRPIADVLSRWALRPIGSEGYRTAEVTVGGVSTRQLDAKTLQVKNIPGLFFIGEVVDVTGWLGGYNFQWAWASGWAAGQVA